MSILDDRDPSVTYSSGQWGQAGSTNEFDSTTTWTSLRGATAKLSFNGTSIGVYGTIVQKGLLQQDAVSSYTVDSNTPVVFTGKSQATTQFKQLFFQSPTLPAGTHTLTITNGVDGDQLFLDFFAVIPSTPSSSSSAFSSPTPASSSSSTSSLSTSTSEIASTTSAVVTPTVPVTVTVIQGASSTAAASSQTAKVASTSNGGNSGAIVGGVVGGVVLLALLVVAFFFVRQKRRRAELDEALKGSNFWDPQPSHDTDTFTEPLKPPPRSYPSYPSMSQAQPDANHFIPYQTTGDSSQYHGAPVQYQPPQGQYQSPQTQYQNPQMQYQHPQNQYQTPPNQYPTAPSRYQTQSPYRPPAYAQNQQYPGPADYASPTTPTELPYSGTGTSPGAGGSNRYLPPSQIANGGQP